MINVKNHGVIIILEGCDKCGKSTQANEIKKYLELETHLPTHIIHSRYVKGSTPEDAQNLSRRTYIDMFELMEDAISGKRNYILDRSYLDEAVYGPLYRGQPNDYIFDLEKQYLPKLNDYIHTFMFRVSPKTLVSREDGDSFEATEVAKGREMELFQIVMDKSMLKYKDVINANMDVTSVTQSVLEKLSAHLAEVS